MRVAGSSLVDPGPVLSQNGLGGTDLRASLAQWPSLSMIMHIMTNENLRFDEEILRVNLSKKQHNKRASVMKFTIVYYQASLFAIKLNPNRSFKSFWTLCGHAKSAGPYKPLKI